VKKLFASLFVAGLLLSGLVGCGGTPTTKPPDTTPKDKATDKAADKAADKKDKDKN
jgi:hypothetical protein